MVCICSCDNQHEQQVPNDAGSSEEENDLYHKMLFIDTMRVIMLKNMNSAIGHKYFIIHSKNNIRPLLENNRTLTSSFPYSRELYLGTSSVSLTQTLLAGVNGMEVLGEGELYLFLKRCHGPGHLGYKEMYQRNKDRFWGVDKYMFYVIELTCSICNSGITVQEYLAAISVFMN